MDSAAKCGDVRLSSIVIDSALIDAENRCPNAAPIMRAVSVAETVLDLDGEVDAGERAESSSNRMLEFLAKAGRVDFLSPRYFRSPSESGRRADLSALRPSARLGHHVV